jgi:hypothetical protein
VSFKASGVFQAPLGIQAAANLQSFSGTPEQSTYQLTKTQIPTLILLSGSSLTNPVNLRGTTSLPTVTMVDLSLGRQFKFGEGKFKVLPKMEFFNLGNASTVLTRSVLLNGTGSSTYQNPNTVLNPRMMRLTLQTNF